MKKQTAFLMVIILLLCAVFTACDTTKNNDEATTVIQETTTAIDSSQWKIAFIVCNAEMRSSAHQALWSGATKFSKETGVSIKYFNAELPHEAESAIETIVSQGYNVIVNVSGNVSQKLLEKAKEHPEIIFVNAENEVEYDTEEIINFINATISAEQSTFLAGYIAGYKTESNIVGYVGGTDNFVSQQLQSGFIAGLKYAMEERDIKIKAIMEYVGTGYDRNGGYDTAKGIYNEGADVVFVAVGGETGGGAIWAAKELDKKCVTMGNSQYIAPNNAIASVNKATDSQIYEICTKIVTGELKAGRTVRYGFESGLISMQENAETTDFLGENLLGRIETVKSGLEDGNIKVSAKLEASALAGLDG